MNSSYSAPAMSAGLMAGIRIATMIVGPYLIGKGIVDPENLDGIITGAATAGVAIYGLVKTFKRQKKLNAAEQTLGPITPTK
jgi:hypothetical protein